MSSQDALTQYQLTSAERTRDQIRGERDAAIEGAAVLQKDVDYYMERSRILRAAMDDMAQIASFKGVSNMGERILAIQAKTDERLESLRKEFAV